MLKKTIDFVDFDDNPQSVTTYFHISKAELIELELSEKGGFVENMEKLIEAEDGKSIIAAFKNLLRMAYGVRSEDGQRFIKTPEAFEEFSQTPAYSELFYELATDATNASAFMNGIVPAALAKEVTAEVERRKMTPREKSEEAMQGHKQAPAEPKVLNTAPPVLADPEPAVAVDSVFESVATPAPKADTADLTTEQLQALLNSRQQNHLK